MKKYTKIFGIVCIFALGVALGLIITTQKQKPTSITLTTGDVPAVMKALTRLSETKIPQAGLHCEVNGTSETSKGMTKNNDVLVGDFIAHYLSWSLIKKSIDPGRLACEGKGIQQCALSFGESKQTEGWDRTLQFNYNQASKTVDPQSLQCIDTP